MKTYLFILRHAAHSGARAQEMLDVILTTAAFDQSVSILLIDDGVFQLKKDQHPENVGLKDTAAIFNALEIYQVYNIYVEINSLQERGLNADELCLSLQTVYRKEVPGLMRQFDLIVGD